MSSDGSAAKAQTVMSQALANRLILGAMAAGLVVLITLAGTAFWLAGKARDYSFWVDHTYVAQSDIIGFEAKVEQAETARRGYLLAPREPQFDRYFTLRRDVTAALFKLADTTKDNPAQQANIARMRPLLNWKLKGNDDSMTLVRGGHKDRALAAFSEEQELQPLLGIRKVVADMLSEEQRLLNLRAGVERTNTDLLLYVALAAAALIAILSLGSIVVMRRYASDLEKTQDELRGLNEALERRVAERTEDLTRANEEIQRFAYIVSHDLRSPLVNVMGFTSELEEGLKPLNALVASLAEHDPARLPDQVKRIVEEELPEAIGFIRAATRKMDRLINAILKLSREGRRNLNPEPLAMTPLVDNLMNSVRHQLAERGATAQVEGLLPDMVSDRVAIEQVLGNLIDNAVKYLSPKRPGHIVVRAEDAGARVVLEVQDNGRGIDPRDHERIFELFRRSGVQDQTGEGIGLAHVRALVYRLGGTISCTSALDQGSTFRISLPRVLSHKEGMVA